MDAPLPSIAPEWLFEPTTAQAAAHNVDMDVKYDVPPVPSHLPASPPLTPPTSAAEVAEDNEEKTNFLSGYPEPYRILIQEAAAFDASILDAKDHEHELVRLQADSWEPGFDGRTLPSLECYPVYPWRYTLKASAFHCPQTQNEGPFLGKVDKQKFNKQMSDLWNHNPDVWEALLGIMLQEGVTVENLLMRHRRGEDILLNQTWILDRERFDNIRFTQRTNTPLPKGCSAEFHKAPDGKAELLAEALHELKTRPETALAFRSAICQWLISPSRERKFREILRKAGWRPHSEISFLHDLIVDMYTNEKSVMYPLKTSVGEYLQKRYPRFFSATIQSEKLPFDLNDMD